MRKNYILLLILRKSNGLITYLCWVLRISFAVRFGFTARKMKFSIKDFFSKCDQTCKKRRIWSNLLKKFWMENFIFCAVLQCTVQNSPTSAVEIFRSCSDWEKFFPYTFCDIVTIAFCIMVCKSSEFVVASPLLGSSKPTFRITFIRILFKWGR